MTDISIEAQISCVKREISMRQRVYPRWVAQGKMTQTEAEKQTSHMQAVLETLEAKAAEGRLL